MVSTQENDIKVEYDSKMLHDVLNKKLDRKHPKYIYIHTNKFLTDSHKINTSDVINKLHIVIHPVAETVQHGSGRCILFYLRIFL